MKDGSYRNHRLALAALATATLGFFAFSAEALKTDDNTLVEGAKLCTRYLPRDERQLGIPKHLLAAIASTESGRFHRALGMNLPWPWTINVEGTGYFFDTKEEAIGAVQSFQARGIASIDVGCMQVNLLHHPYAFATLDQAFDPAYNVAYGAQFLKKNFEEEGSWRKATADYHSRTLSYGEPYAQLVFGAWSRIINKVADARAGRPILSAAASRPSSPHYAHLQQAHSYHSMHMHIISVGRDTTRENGVIVVRPDYGSAAVRQVASNDDDLLIHPRRVEPERDMVEHTLASTNGVDIASNGEASHGAEIIHIHSDGTVSAKGQFEHSVHAVHAADSPSSSPDAPKSLFINN